MGSALATLGFSTTTFAAQGHTESADERKACQIAAEFSKSAFGDSQKAQALLADNFEYRGDPKDDMRKGKDAYIQQMAQFANGPPGGQPMPFKIGSPVVVSCTAVGAKGDILVLQLRKDQIISTKTNKLLRYEPVGAFYRVNPTTWLLEEWLDAPINPQTAGPGGPGGPPGGPGGPPGAGGPPDGAPPAGGPPPGGPPPAGQ
jgi:hypothetical protein